MVELSGRLDGFGPKAPNDRWLKVAAALTLGYFTIGLAAVHFQTYIVYKIFAAGLLLTYPAVYLDARNARETPWDIWPIWWVIGLILFYPVIFVYLYCRWRGPDHCG